MILKNDQLIDLLSFDPIENFDSDNLEHLVELNKKSIKSISISRGVLPRIPPFEQHPYLEPLTIDCEKTGLMIGTFPPISYLCDTLKLNQLKFRNQTISPPDLPYFHGNYASLWKYAPIDFNQIIKEDRSLQPNLIKLQLRSRGVIYTDIIKYCQRQLDIKNEDEKYTASDKLLKNIVINDDVYNYLINNQSINRIYFTNSSFFSTNNFLFDKNSNLRLQENDAFGLFLKGANDRGIKIDVSLPNNPENWINLNEGNKTKPFLQDINDKLLLKVYLNLRLSNGELIRKFQICSTVSPAAVNRGMVRQNQCVKNYSRIQNCPIPVSPEKLLRLVLMEFFNDNLANIQQYNA